MCACMASGDLTAPESSSPPASVSAALAFANRLGDWLFLAARWENHLAGTPEPDYVAGGRADAGAT